jgi:hypothetical protein
MQGADWDSTINATIKVSLIAGYNTIKFFHPTMWTPDLDRIIITGGTCTAESNAAFCTRVGKNCGSVTANDNCGNARTVSSCGSCPSGLTCGGASNLPSVCSLGYEAESATRSGTASTSTSCPLASGGYKLMNIGGGSSNTVTFNVSAPTAGNYRLTFMMYSDVVRATSTSASTAGRPPRCRPSGHSTCARFIRGPRWFPSTPAPTPSSISTTSP